MYTSKSNLYIEKVYWDILKVHLFRGAKLGTAGPNRSLSSFWLHNKPNKVGVIFRVGYLDIKDRK